MIINIRGTSGSGKSTIVHELLHNYVNEPITDSEHFKKPKIVGYKLPAARRNIEQQNTDLPLYVVGEYSQTCGGADTITRTNVEGWKGMDYIEHFVREAALHGNVLFEGLLITGIWGRFHQISKDFPGRFVFAFMDTPIEKCLERIQIRNGGKPIKEENTRGKYRAMELAIEKARNNHERSVIINHERAYEQVIDLLSEGGWIGIPKENPLVVGLITTSDPSPSALHA